MVGQRTSMSSEDLQNILGKSDEKIIKAKNNPSKVSRGVDLRVKDQVQRHIRA
jgi:hypothetical protein